MIGPTRNPPSRLGDFEIVRELGRGGMGVVYEARQVSLNRKVALKVLAAGLGLTPRAVERFHREAEAAAKLHHTNIVPVYATGEQDGTHFYAMELIEGPSLDHVIRRLRQPTGTSGEPTAPELLATGPYVQDSSTSNSASLSNSSLRSGGTYFDTVAKMIADVADALDHAHKNGVIHRDVKPSNLLLSPDGRLSVNDFGLARMLEQPGMTMTGEFMGTPAYMSPEQITAGRTPLDHRTDLYSLGATLYELLTLQPPFPGERRDQVLSQIIHKEAKPPRSLNKKVPVDLETICLKAMDKDPDRRYQTGKALAEDLRRFVNRFAIQARRVGFLGRGVKWARRNPAMAALVGCLFLVVLAAGFFAFQAKLAQDQLRAAERQAALDKGILEAMNGDFEAATKAVAEAENKGAEPGLLNMLRGLIADYRGQHAEAVALLELADQQLHNSVAVKALLAGAYINNGQIQRVEELVPLLEDLAPRTAEDFLFLGMVQAGLDPVAGLRTLDRGLAQYKTSHMARLARVNALASLAQMTGRVDDAERALEEVQKIDLPGSPLLVLNRMQAHLILAHASEVMDPRRTGAFAQAKREADSLANFPRVPGAVSARCVFYVATGDDQHLLEVIQNARRQGVPLTPLTKDWEVLALCRGKKFDEALKTLNSSEGGAGNGDFLQATTRGIVHASLGLKDPARNDFATALDGYTRGISLAYIPAYMHLLGPEAREPTRQKFQQILVESAHLVPSWRNGWYHDLLAFHAGKFGAETLVEKAGASRYNQCEAFFYIGLSQLGEGDRGAAKTWFHKCQQTGVFMFIEYVRSRLFLECLEDPNWLPWILPPRK